MKWVAVAFSEKRPSIHQKQNLVGVGELPAEKQASAYVQSRFTSLSLSPSLPLQQFHSV